MSREPEIVARADDLTPRWMTEVLRHGGALGEDAAVAALEWATIGTGQIGENVRCALAYEGAAGPATVVCKFGSQDPASAAAGVQLLLYETEVAFYRELAPTVDVASPHSYFAGVRPGTADAVIVMEDLTPAAQGDQIAGCTPGQAALVVEEAAKLHGPRWGDPGLGRLAWLDRAGGGLESVVPFFWESFVERHRSSLLDVTLDAGEVLAEWGAAAAPDPSQRVPVHYDFRLDNMLFGADTDNRPVVVVDWQTVQLDRGVRDVAYFLGSALVPEDRRAVERELVARYHRVLVEDYGVGDYPFEQCWTDYVAESYSSLAMAVFASMVVGRTDRGDAMFMAMANRSAQMGADLDAPAARRGR